MLVILLDVRRGNAQYMESVMQMDVQLDSLTYQEQELVKHVPLTVTLVTVMVLADVIQVVVLVLTQFLTPLVTDHVKPLAVQQVVSLAQWQELANVILVDVILGIHTRSLMKHAYNAMLVVMVLLPVQYVLKMENVAMELV